MMDDIAAIAAEVRAKEIGARGLGDDPPATLCLEFSKLLRQALEDAGYDAAVIQGQFEVDEPNFEYYDDWDEDETSEAFFTPLHYWVEVTGKGGETFPEPIVADITADQFNDEIDSEADYMEPVEVGPYPHLPRHIRGDVWHGMHVSRYHAAAAKVRAWSRDILEREHMCNACGADLSVAGRAGDDPERPLCEDCWRRSQRKPEPEPESPKRKWWRWSNGAGRT